MRGLPRGEKSRVVHGVIPPPTAAPSGGDLDALVERTLTPREFRFRSSAVAHTGHVSPLGNSYSRELYFSALRVASLMACRYADTLKRSSALRHARSAADRFQLADRSSHC